MTLLQKLALAATIGPATFAVAASIPKTILPDNVVRCEPDSGCTSQVLYGRSYKVITTPRFTVMVAISHEGSYTRADVSITNKTDTPLSMSPEDFRVEVLTPKPKVLLYVSPANLVLPPTSPAQSALATTATKSQPSTHLAAAFTDAHPSTQSSDIDEAAAAKEKSSQESAGKVATDHDLSASSIAPNGAASGRVFFERDKHAHLINVCLPIAGMVFEFPYAMKK
jgi:hypothetical protein